MWLKIEVPLNVRKVWSNKMLVLPNVAFDPSNVRKKNKGTTEYDKSTITCDIGITQFKGGSIKYEKKNTRTTECGKRAVKCDVSTA